jgi:RNA polymerase sigma-70 factor (ECF subfamily)
MAENSSEKELIQNSLNGDMRSFKHLVEYYQPYVYSIAFRFFNNKTDSDDVVQECFIRVWKNLHRYKSKYKFSTWIYKIVNNLCLDHYRRQKRNKSQSMEEFSVIENLIVNDELNAENILINTELKKMVYKAVENLSPKQKMVFILRDIEGMEIVEIVKIMNISPGRIKSNLYYARKRLRQLLEKIYK